MTLIAQVDPKAVVSVADTLGGKSDRVLFIAAILVILLIGIFAARYLIQRNDVLTKKLEEISDKSIAATKLTFFPYADPQSNVFKVRVYLPLKTEGLYPGMFVKTAFRIGEEIRLTVPQQALVQRGEVSAVYVVKDDRISLRQVRPGRIEGDRIEILAGLEPDEQVALDPIQAGIYLKQQQRSPEAAQ